jgi:HEAT repeat protein
MDDPHLIELLRQFADCLEHPKLEQNPLGEIEDLGEEAVGKLLEALDHEEASIRRMAVCALGCLHSLDCRAFDLTPTLPRLERILQSDSDPLTKLYAAEALWMLNRHEAAIQVFVGGLQESKAEARRYAAAMLGIIGPRAKEAVQPLIGSLSDSDVFVRRYAAGDLGAFGPAATEALPTLETFLGEDELTRMIGVEAILHIDSCRTEELCPVLLQATKSRSPRIRHHATQALGELPISGELAAPSLAELLDDEEDCVRMGAMWALEHLGPAASPAVPTLLKILRGDGIDADDILVRGTAADALGAIGDDARQAGFFLLECLQEPRDDTMETYFHLRVARALWHIQREPGHLLGIGLDALKSPDWWLRRTGAVLLADLEVAGQAAIPQLRRLLKDENRMVSDAARKALERIAVG